MVRRGGDRRGGAPPGGEPEGGEMVCYLDLVCPECGAVLDGAGHREPCRAGPDAPEPTPTPTHGRSRMGG